MDSLEMLQLAEDCGATITGKPDAGEAVTVVLTCEAWREFSAKVIHANQGASDLSQKKIVALREAVDTLVRFALDLAPQSSFWFDVWRLHEYRIADSADLANLTVCKAVPVGYVEYNGTCNTTTFEQPVEAGDALYIEWKPA